MTFDINLLTNQSHPQVAVRERIDTSRYINLSNNEMSHADLKSLLASFHSKFDWSQLAHYPLCAGVRKQVAQLYDLQFDQVLLSAGTDNAIAQILQYFSFKNKSLVMQEPNFFNYENYAKVYNLKIFPVLFQDISDSDIINSFAGYLENNNHTIVVITSPHVYSGGCVSSTVINSLIEICDTHHHLLVIDEAYAAFSTVNHLHLVREGKSNILVLRSFSKAFGLAGMRIGGIFGHANTIEILKKVGILGCINEAAIELLSYLIEHHAEIEAIRQDLIAVREWFSHQLALIFPHWQILPSSANFVTAFIPDFHESDAVTNHLRTQNILIKQLKKITSFDNAIRITISDWQVMETVVECLRGFRQVYSKSEISVLNA